MWCYCNSHHFLYFGDLIFERLKSHPREWPPYVLLRAFRFRNIMHGHGNIRAWKYFHGFARGLCNPVRGSGQEEISKKKTGRVGSSQVGSGQQQEMSEISWVWSGPVRSGRIRGCSTFHGYGRVNLTGSDPAKSDPTRKRPWNVFFRCPAPTKYVYDEVLFFLINRVSQSLVSV